MGRAEQLFVRIREKGAAEIHGMIAAQFTEELFLDYKRSSTTLPSARLNDDDRKNLAKAISGFANSEGGVIVWGVDCRQTPQTFQTRLSRLVTPALLRHSCSTGPNLNRHFGQA
jgi:predicted HTH transcriptional regulator